MNFFFIPLFEVKGLMDNVYVIELSLPGWPVCAVHYIVLYSHLPNTRNFAIWAWVSMFTVFIWWQLYVDLIFNYMYSGIYCESISSCIYLYTCTVCGEKRLLSCDNQQSDIRVILMHIKRNNSPNFPHVVSGLTFYISKINSRSLQNFKPLKHGVTIRVNALPYFFMYLLSSILQIEFKLKMEVFL